jgi:nitric-oxide synthase
MPERSDNGDRVAAQVPATRAEVAATRPAVCPVDRGVARASSATDVLAEAWAFLELYCAETGRVGLATRWAQVRSEIEATGTWRQTTDELTFGARVAWRQSVRCIGRLRWPSLVVRDLRHVTRAADVYRELSNHLGVATNGGRIRSTISIFPADTVVGPRVRIWNDQLIRYAGWRTDRGSVVGDPRYVPFTDLVTALGWPGPRLRGRFDILPWVIETAEDEPGLFAVPESVPLEVPLRHPSYPWFADLQLRWHALPVISNMRLRIGGVNYSAAPFSGFYLSAEIATRNLADADRYNQLPLIAARLGLDPAADRLWRDKALLTLNEAVLSSFTADKVTIVDHHSESRNFRLFAEKEEAAGRAPYGDWAWLNGLGPMTPQDPSWGRRYAEGEPNPNFWLDDDAAAVSRGEPPAVTLRHLHHPDRGPVGSRPTGPHTTHDLGSAPTVQVGARGGSR